MSSKRRGTGDMTGTGGPTTGELSTRVALRLAERKGVGVEELTPLAETIDPESLNRLFASDSQAAHVTFTHDGYDITVTGDDRIVIEPTA